MIRHICIRILLPASLVAGTLSPGTLAAQASPSEPTCRAAEPERALAEVRRAYMDGFNAGDADAVARLHTETVVSMPAGMPAVEGRDALRELVAGSLRHAPEGFRFAFEPTEVRIADGWAVERGVTRAHVGDDGPAIPPGKYVLLYERDGDGCWRIAWSITNTDAPRS
ncbi:MAG: YybH family protein [Gemmatimonadota bacterium]